VDRAFAVLLVGALLISPLGWTYYFWLPLGPIALLAHGWWRDRDTASPWSRRLLLASLPGLMFPLFFCDIFQPSLWATLFVGNLYFVSLALVWLALVLDGLRPAQPQPAAALACPA
jgi:hypothetical protein